jgi:isocitrate/isopropylmalate dehydrogenase
MARYRIAWLPGDGIGRDVMDAARLVLDRLGVDADYLPGDIGWDFWCREGDALPPRTIELLRTVDAALFGAITSKPTREAERELAPERQGQGLVYRSPIVRMRQLFDLYVCLRPCRAYPSNPLNFREGSTSSSSARTRRTCTPASSSRRCRRGCVTCCSTCPGRSGRSATFPSTPTPCRAR